MDPGHDKRQEEHGQYLRVNALLYFLPGHAYFHQDIKTILIFISFRNLFVIHDEYRTKKEHCPQHHAQKEKPAVNSYGIRSSARLGINIIVRIIHGHLYPVRSHSIRSSQCADPFQDRIIDVDLFLIFAVQVKSIALFYIGDRYTLVFLCK